MKDKSLLIGVGNPYLKDDRAGLEVVERVIKSGCPWDIEVLYHIGFDLLDKILGYKNVIIIDACKGNGRPGAVFVWDRKEILKRSIFSINTHGFGINHIIEIGDSLYPELMPRDLKMILIEVEDVESFSSSCSPLVKKAIEKVVEYLISLWGTE